MTTTIVEGLEFPQDQITLFGVRYLTPNKLLSPTGWVVRHGLAIKELSYHTQWIESKDVDRFCKSIGARPTDKLHDGSDLYTLPVIYDPFTKSVVSGTFDIAEHLDKNYPSCPRIFRFRGMKGLHRVFIDAYKPVDVALGRLLIPKMIKFVPEESTSSFRRTMEAWLGEPFEAVYPTGEEEYKAAVKGLENLFGMVDKWYDPEESQPFIMGSKACFADLVVISRVWWVRAVLGRDDPLFRDILSWNNSRWGKLLLSVETLYK